MLRILFTCTWLSLWAPVVHAQEPLQEPAQVPILLWPTGAPGALGTTADDQPALFAYPHPGAKATVIVLPGGGYQHLAITYEGYDVGRWLNEHGMAAFVLRYRLGPKYHHPIELGDAQRAIRYVRSHAAEYKIPKDEIGVWGFSAGGHLASTAETHFDVGKPDATDPVERESSRPDFAVLAYPVITMREPYLHVGSRKNLLGDHPSEPLVNLLSNEGQVTVHTPPTFLFHTSEDRVVPVQNSIMFYNALVKFHVPAELHVYQKGRHGVGLAKDDAVLGTWPDRLADWLRIQGLR